MFIVVCPLVGFGQASLESDPAYLPIDKVLDLKTIQPEVNVNLPRFLLKDAAAELNGAPGSPLAGTGIDFADLVKDVKLIRVVVIEANKTNRPALDKAVKTLRADLEAKWTPIVSVPQENVGIYAMGDPSGESMTGVAVLVYDGGDAVIGNIVGHVSIGKLIKIASQSDKLPKDLLKKLQGFANPTGASTASDGQGSTKDSKPAETREASAKDPAAK
jgi:hypothetical protein